MTLVEECVRGLRVLGLALLVGCSPNPGPHPADSGTPPADSGTPPTDSGAPHVDAYVPLDSGPAPDPDAGDRPDAATTPDSGGGQSDAGSADGGACDPTTGTVCPGAPDSPVIDGEPSAGHDSPTWTWSTPAGAVSFQYRIDGGAWMTGTETSYQASGLAPGSYEIEVMACNADGVCSPPASFTTVVEILGPGYSGIWAGVERPNLATTAIGNVVPISCHNCYNGPNDEVYDAAAARAKIATALGRGADLIEIDIADAGGTLCAHHGDLSSCAGSPTLAELLSDATLTASDAMLFIEIKESGATPAAFATQILTLLDAHREVVRNGRPLFLRAFASIRSYLTAIRTAAADYPMIAPYLRYSVLYGASTTPVATMQADIATDVAGAGFDMVELHYQQTNMAGLVSYAQSLGLAVGVWTIPGSFGEVFIAALREMVDELTAEYRVDQARIVVEEANTFAYVNGWSCGSAADTTADIWRNFSGTPIHDTFTVGTAATTSTYGTPPLWFDPVGEDRFGCSLDHRVTNGVTERAVDLGVHDSGAGAGYLVTAIVNFDTLAGLNGTQAILNSAEAGGFALELNGDGTTTTLRFGVHVGGSYRYHGYDVGSTGLSNNPTLNGTDAYLLVGAYDGDGGVYLFVDNERVGSGGSFTGDVTSSGQPILIGADPQPSAALGARFFFDGFIQQVEVLRWGDHSFTGSNVN